MSCSIYFSYFGQFQALLAFSSQRWKLSPDKYWDALPAKSQAIQWITPFDSRRAQFKLLWIAFDYKTTALTKVAGVLQMVSYQWPVLLALRDMRLVPSIHWVKAFGALHSHWMVKGGREKHIDILKMLEIKNEKQQNHYCVCSHAPTHAQKLLIQQFFFVYGSRLGTFLFNSLVQCWTGR